DYCISVSPIDEDERIAPFGSTGPEIDVGYYGVRILSLGKNGGYAVMSGSSMSAPLVAGLLALRIDWEIRNGGRKTFTVEDAVKWLQSCCKDAGDPGRDDVFGIGIPDALEAFQTFGKQPVPVPTTPPGFDLFNFSFHTPALATD